MAESGTTIENTGATPYWNNANTVCQRSGKKVKPGVLVLEWTNLWVHPDYLDIRSPQDFVRVRAEELRGSIRPEAENVFITTRVLASDL